MANQTNNGTLNLKKLHQTNKFANKWTNRKERMEKSHASCFETDCKIAVDAIFAAITTYGK